MKLHSAGLAALSLAIALGLSACGGDKQAAQQPAADGAAAPAAAGAKVTAEVSGAGASFIFPLVSKCRSVPAAALHRSRPAPSTSVPRTSR
ncbi:hypothetical protein G6F56_014266 [Rhizopus delemar]|nr:hypothetical protein G6F56_014266 [Rhizopus delemar]